MRKFISILLAMAMLLSCTGIAVAENNTVDLVYGMTGSWNSLFPYAANTTNSWMIQDILFEPLLKPGNGEIYYRAAESMEPDADFLTWTVHLNRNCTWHDGEACTAYDWVWTYETVTNPDFGTYDGTTQMNVFAGTDAIGKQIEGEEVALKVIDDYTFTMTFKVKTSIYDYAGNTTYCFRALPEHLLKDIPVSEIAESDFFKAPVGNGCCVFESQPVIGNELHLTANKNFYLGAPEFDSITYLVVDSTNAANAFLSGEIDLYNGTLSKELRDQIVGQNGLWQNLDTCTRTIQLMYVNNETLNLQVRKALDMLIDKDILVEAIAGGDGIAQGDNCLTYLPCYIEYEHTVDTEAAIALLKEGGFDFDRTLTIAANDSTTRVNTAMIIQQMWAAAGIKSEIVTGDLTTTLGMQRDGESDVVLGGWAEKYDPCSQMSNLVPETDSYNHISVYTYKDAGDAVHFAATDEERLAAQQNWQLVLRDECPMIFLYSTPAYQILSSKIKGGTLSGMMDMPWLWDVAGVND